MVEQWGRKIASRWILAKPIRSIFCDRGILPPKTKGIAILRRRKALVRWTLTNNRSYSNISSIATYCRVRVTMTSNSKLTQMSKTKWPTGTRRRYRGVAKTRSLSPPVIITPTTMITIIIRVTRNRKFKKRVRKV